MLSVTGTAEPREIATASYKVIEDIDAPEVDFVYGNRQEPDLRCSSERR